MPAVGIRLLGALEVDGPGILRPRDRLALAALAVRRRQVVAPDQLADALWGDSPPDSWPKQVQICVARLRKAVGAATIETRPGGYRLALDGEDIDADRFERLVERGRTLAATGEPDRAASIFARALAMWRGPPFDEVRAWPPGQAEATRLEELRRSAEEELLDARLSAGEHRAVAAEAEALVAGEPLRERRWAILALAQYRWGRQADALRSLNRARRTLVDQLGIEPGGELVALEAAILRQDPELVAGARTRGGGGGVPVQGPGVLRRGRHRCVLRPGRRGDRLPGAVGFDPAARRRRALGMREVVARPGRAGARPAAPGSDRRAVRPGPGPRRRRWPRPTRPTGHRSSSSTSSRSCSRSAARRMTSGPSPGGSPTTPGTAHRW